jgi:hypothetical protein
MGHLITISQVLIQTASTDAVVDKILSETSEWLDYVKGPLAQTRAIQATRLADYVSSGKNLYKISTKSPLKETMIHHLPLNMIQRILTYLTIQVKFILIPLLMYLKTLMKNKKK